MHPHLPNFFGNGKLPRLSGNDHPNIAPYSSFATGQGQIFITAGNDGQFARLVGHLDAPELADDPRFVDNAARLAHRPELRATLESLLASTSAEELAEELMGIGVPAGPILTAEQGVDHPHTAHREMVVEMEGGYRHRRSSTGLRIVRHWRGCRGSRATGTSSSRPSGGCAR